MKPVRIGFIGAGGNTRLRHLPGFAEIAGVELVAVANRSLASSQRVAAEFGIDRVHSDWREIIAAEDIDAVCIGTWPNTHAEMAGAALAAGKHVLVEARMASSLAEAKAMAAAAAARPDRVAQIVPSPFTLEADDVIQRCVASGELGELRRISSEHTTEATLDPDAALSWRQDERLSGINTMALGICYEPMLRWFTGDAAVSAAEAAVVTPQRRDADGREHTITIPERLTVAGHWGEAILHMSQSSVDPGPARCIYEIEGAKATLRYDAYARELSMKSVDGADRKITIPHVPNGGWAVEEQFIASIRSGAPVTLTDFTTGLRYMAFTDAVWQDANRPA